MCKKSLTKKLVGAKSLPSSHSQKHKTMGRIFLVSFISHQQLRKRAEKARQRNASQHKTLTLTTSFSKKTPACQALALIDKNKNLAYTQPRFSQAIAAPTACEVTQLNAYSKRH